MKQNLLKVNILVAVCIAAVVLSGCRRQVTMQVIHSGIVNKNIENAQCPFGLAKDSKGRYITNFIDGGDIVAGCANYFSRTDDLGKTWSPPFLKLVPEQKELGTSITFTQLSDGRVLGTRMDVKHTDTSAQGFLHYRTSTADVIELDPDTGEIKVLFRLNNPADSMNAPMGNGIVELSSGELLPSFIFYYGDPENPEFPAGSGFYRSKDGGRTWGDFELMFKEADPENPLSFNEAVIIEAVSGELVAFARTDSRDVNWTYRVISKDMGKTWSMPEKMDIDIIYPVSLRTSKGDYLIACGDRRAPGNRPTTIYHSKDGLNFTSLGHPVYSSGNLGGGGSQALIEVSPDVFLVTFYGFDSSVKRGIYIDSCLFRLNR